MSVIKYDGKVTAILNPTKLVINRGSVDGVKIDNVYVVFSLGESLSDPDTGEILGELEIVKGKGKVIHVQERIATIETFEYEEGTRTIAREQNIPSWLGLGSTITESQRQKKIFEDVQRGDFVRRVS